VNNVNRQYSTKCFRIQKTDAMPIQIRNAPSACTLSVLDAQDKTFFERKLYLLLEDDIALLMEMNLVFVICCPTHIAILNSNY
jgi:hypothetical protein